MKMKDFVQKIPFLVGSPYPEAYARRALLVYEDEIKNPDGPFKHENFKFLEDRVELVFGFKRYNREKMQHCFDLCALAYLVHRQKEHGEDRHEEISLMQAALEVEEIQNPEITSTLSASEIVASPGIWDED